MAFESYSEETMQRKAFLISITNLLPRFLNEKTGLKNMDLMIILKTLAYSIKYEVVSCMMPLMATSDMLHGSNIFE